MSKRRSRKRKPARPARLRRNRRNRRRNIGNENSLSINQSSAPNAYSYVSKNRGLMDQLTITHSEYVCDIESDGTSSQIINRDINPGLEEEFPWLAGIANSFETYRFTKLVYRWVPQVSTSTTGAIALCPDYDAADIDSSHSKTELLSFQDSVRGTIWKGFSMAGSTANLGKSKQYYVRHTTVSGTDIKTYDTLQLNILVENEESAGTVLGALFVDYRVILYTPQLNHESAVNSQLYRNASTVTAEDIFSSAVQILNGNMDIGAIPTKNITYRLPDFTDTWEFLRPGTYNISIRGTGVSGTISDINLSLDSDTGDSSLTKLLTAVDTVNNTISVMWRAGVGALTSMFNPMEAIIAQTGTGTASTWDVMLTELTGYALPTLSDEQKLLRKQKKRGLRNCSSRRRAKFRFPLKQIPFTFKGMKRDGEIEEGGEDIGTKKKNSNINSAKVAELLKALST